MDTGKRDNSSILFGQFPAGGYKEIEIKQRKDKMKLQWDMA